MERRGHAKQRRGFITRHLMQALGVLAVLPLVAVVLTRERPRSLLEC